MTAAQQKLADLQATGGMVPDLNTGGMSDAGGQAAIAAAQAAVDRLTAALQREKTATDQAREAQQSLAQAQAIRSAIPLIGQTQDLQNQLTLLQNLANAPDVNDRLVKTGQSLNDLQRAIAATGAALQALPKNALVDFLGAAATPAQKLDAQIEQLRAKAAQIGASPAQFNQAVGAAGLESAMEQQQMRQNALGGAKQSLEALKQRRQAAEEGRVDDRSEHRMPKAA